MEEEEGITVPSFPRPANSSQGSRTLSTGPISKVIAPIPSSTRNRPRPRVTGRSFNRRPAKFVTLEIPRRAGKVLAHEDIGDRPFAPSFREFRDRFLRLESD